MENLNSYTCKISQKIASLTPPIVPPTIVNTTNLPSSTIDILTHEPRSSIKLPKLTVNKFYGDHKNWLEFLGQFENATDKNSCLSKIEKLICLKSLVGGVAAKAISGFALTEKFSRKNKSDNWDLKALLEFLGEEIQSRERAQSFHSSVREKQNSNNSKQECDSFAFGSRSNNRNAYVKQKGNNSLAAELLVNQSTANSKCIFCCENLHNSSSCESVSIEIKIRLENKDDPNSYLEIKALETEKISAAHIPPPDIYISIYNTHLKGLKLADTTNSVTNVSVLIGADNYYNVMTGRIKRISRKLVAAESLYEWCLIGISGPPNKNSSDFFAMKVVVEEGISRQLDVQRPYSST
ncbi:integrase catalytic domain-containing protein [Trichonephila clavipes]|nr:integrase catalytic domain-containing protein [Trichonephila clavipes]